MKRILSIGILSVALAFVGAPKAEAAFITGQLDIAAGASFVIGSTGVATTIGSATGLDFGTGGPTPGVAGTFIVVAATGSFLAAGIDPLPLPVTQGLITDFTFQGAGSVAFPTVPIATFQSIVGPAFNFNLTSVLSVIQTANFLAVLGAGTMSLAGYDDTPGLFAFTTQDPSGQNTGIFAFSATDIAVPEPGTMLLLGTGLLGLAAAARRRMRKA